MKLFNTLEEICSDYGVHVEMPESHHKDKCAVFKIIDLYNVKYVCWINEGDWWYSMVYRSLGDGCIICLPEIWKRHEEVKMSLNKRVSFEIFDKYEDALEFGKMEEYIASYKHLIGCEYVGSWFNSLDCAMTWIFTEDKLNDFYIKYKPLLFITDKDELVSYKEYMTLYYPEYAHIWKHQL